MIEYPVQYTGNSDLPLSLLLPGPRGVRGTAESALEAAPTEEGTGCRYSSACVTASHALLYASLTERYHPCQVKKRRRRRRGLLPRYPHLSLLVRAVELLLV